MSTNTSSTLRARIKWIPTAHGSSSKEFDEEYKRASSKE